MPKIQTVIFGILIFMGKNMATNVRLDKCLTVNCGFSRKEACRIIHSGVVTVNGIQIKDSSCKINPTDVVHLDNELLSSNVAVSNRYFMLNKPAGYVCASSDSLNPIVLSLIEEPAVEKLFCVGRLDLDTEGLLLVTDDGAWSHRITSPKHHCNKTYKAILADPCPVSAISTFEKGVQLNGEKGLTKPATLKIIEPNMVELTISEGKYHQVKRMFAAIGNKVIELKRIAIGELTLEDLEPGEYRSLTAEEINRF
jgi:16S rRNA pseudouridine516 synthase